jgi:CHAT domain-containing protein/tetratricopeptide (TPR) repeat protein
MKMTTAKLTRRRPNRTLVLCLCLIMAGWCYVAPRSAFGQKRSAKRPNQSPELNEATRLSEQFDELYKEGRYEEAVSPAESALAIREKVLGLDHPSVANSLNDLGDLCYVRGDYGRAESLLSRALAIREKALGPNHPMVATSLSNLALLYKKKGEYERADPLFRRALMIYFKAGGPQDQAATEVINQIASLYYETGNYGKAVQLLEMTLAIREKGLGPDHPEVAQSLNNLAVVYSTKGEYERAEPLHERAVAIYEKAFGPDHPKLAPFLSNLASVYYENGDEVRAAQLLQRALLIRVKALSRDHPEVAESLNSLAWLFHNKGDFEAAEPAYRRVLAIYEKAFGPDHPEVALSLNNLGGLYYTKGDYGKAEPLLERALAIREKVLGPDHPDVAQSLTILAVLYEAKGDYHRAVQFQSRSNEVRERNLALMLATGSDLQKFAYLRKLSGETNGTVTLHARAAPSDPQALYLSLTTILRRKGRALDAMTDQISSLRTRLNPQDRALLKQLLATQSRLSKLVLGGRDNMSAKEYGAVVARLENEVEGLQDKISRRSAEFRVQTQPVTIEQVQQALPPGAALVEFFTYRPFHAEAKTEAERFDPARYVVYVLPNEGRPVWADIGEATSLETDLTRLLVALRCPQTVDDIEECPSVPEMKRLARTVDERVMRPVRKLLGETRHVFISPDGALNLLPFAALVDENDKYLVENYSLTYLTSGRDLLRLQLSAKSREAPLIIADPTFGRARQTSPAVRSQEPVRADRPADLVEVNFSPLSGTGAEAKALAAVLPNARVLTRAQATEAPLKRARAPRLLHIATHGFFLPDQPAETAQGTRGFDFDPKRTGPRLLIRSENPLLRSGLAMAGANLPPTADSEDGILTALETAALDLWGTKLVVLSACETGVGEVKNGEGVYGLRRALVLAGSESQMMSLWQVSDKATKDLMVGYYKRLLAGEGRTEALRQVQLEMLRSGRRTTSPRGPVAAIEADYNHPYYWASFIQSGDWRDLNPQPGPPPK